MKLGLYTTSLHAYSLDEAIEIVRDLGLTGMEINTGGFAPNVHIPDLAEIIKSPKAAQAYQDKFRSAGLEIAGLNCNGNPLNPVRSVGERHAQDIREAILAASALGQTRVVTMSGLPAAEPGGTRPNWVVNAWTTGWLDILEYQWSVAVPFWQEIDRLAGDHGVKVALEFHPHNLAFNPSSLRELIARGDLKNIGVELDASHLFWQLMDPVDVVRDLGPLVFHAAAKDTRINPAARVEGVLENRFIRVDPENRGPSIGGDEWGNDRETVTSAWDFVAVGLGHDVDWWADFLRALHAADPDMWVNIEHHDASMSRLDGLRLAVKNLKAADAMAAQ